MKGYWRQFVPAAVVAALMLGAAYGPRVWEAAWEPWTTAWWQSGWQAGWTAGRAEGEAKAMASWLVEGAGDATYNGTYTESGTYKGAPTYTNGTRWLAKSPDETRWVLCTEPDLANGYMSDGDTLPGNPWSASGANPPAPTVSEAAATHSISGRVTENSSGLDGIAIALTGDATDDTQTAGGGYYSFSGLPDGDYIVTPEDVGYTFDPTHCDVELAGADATGRDFAATAIPTGTGVIQGRITLYGVPLAGVLVEAGGKSDTTDANGEYEITDLPAGQYTVTATKAGYAFAPASVPVILTA